MFVDIEGEVVTSSNGNLIALNLDSSSSQFTPRFDAGTKLWS